MTQRWQDKLREAAKQTIRRMATLKKKRKHLDPPEWFVKAYNETKKDDMAKLMMQCNFDKELCVYTCSLLLAGEVHG